MTVVSAGTVHAAAPIAAGICAATASGNRRIPGQSSARIPPTILNASASSGTSALWFFLAVGALIVAAVNASLGGACRVNCRRYLSQRSWRVLQSISWGMSAPEGRTILPNVLRLHLPMSMYSLASSQSLIRWPVLPQNLQRGAFFRHRAPSALTWALTASWSEMVACGLALAVAFA